MGRNFEMDSRLKNGRSLLVFQLDIILLTGLGAMGAPKSYLPKRLLGKTYVRLKKIDGYVTISAEKVLLVAFLYWFFRRTTMISWPKLVRRK